MATVIDNSVIVLHGGLFRSAADSLLAFGSLLKLQAPDHSTPIQLLQMLLFILIEKWLKLLFAVDVRSFGGRELL